MSFLETFQKRCIQFVAVGTAVSVGAIGIRLGAVGEIRDLVTGQDDTEAEGFQPFYEEYRDNAALYLPSNDEAFGADEIRLAETTFVLWGNSGPMCTTFRVTLGKKAVQMTAEHCVYGNSIFEGDRSEVDGETVKVTALFKAVSGDVKTLNGDVAKITPPPNKLLDSLPALEVSGKLPEPGDTITTRGYGVSTGLRTQLSFDAEVLGIIDSNKSPFFPSRTRSPLDGSYVLARIINRAGQTGYLESGFSGSAGICRDGKVCGVLSKIADAETAHILLDQNGYGKIGLSEELQYVMYAAVNDLGD